MAEPLYRANVLICGGTGCLASGSAEVRDALNKGDRPARPDGEVRVVQTGCRGFCAMGPVMIIYPEGIFYCQVQARDVQSIVEETLVKGRVIERLTYKDPVPSRTAPLPGYPLLQQADADHPAQLRPDRPGETSRSTSPTAATRPWPRCCLDMTPAGGHRGGQDLRPAGPRGGRFSDRPQVGVHRQGAGRGQVRGLQRRRGRPRGLHGPHRSSKATPTAVIEGMIIGGLAIGAREGLHLLPGRVSSGHRAAADGHRPGRGIRPAGRRHPGHRTFVFELTDQGRGGRLRLRRGDGPDGLHRGPAGRTPAPAALPGRVRPLGQADQHQQRQELRQHPPDHRQRGRLVRRHRHRAQPGHGHLRPDRARSTTPAWSRCPWASPWGRSSSTSAAASPTGRNSRRSRPGGPWGAACRAST